MSTLAFSAGCQVNHVVPTPAATVTLTRAANGNRTNVIASTATAHDEYHLPTPTDIGESYRFIWGGNAADADTIIFQSAAADGLTFSGGILSHDEDANTGTATALSTSVAMKFRGSGDDDKITLDNPTGFDITFVATSLTNYVVCGWASSTDTHVAFGDQ